MDLWSVHTVNVVIQLVLNNLYNCVKLHSYVNE